MVAADCGLRRPSVPKHTASQLSGQVFPVVGELEPVPGRILDDLILAARRRRA